MLTLLLLSILLNLHVRKFFVVLSPCGVLGSLPHANTVKPLIVNTPVEGNFFIVNILVGPMVVHYREVLRVHR